MADLSDVVAKLTETVTAAVYPNGTSSASVAGPDISIMQGWPIDTDLETMITNDTVLVSVYPRPGMFRNATRYDQKYQDLQRPDKIVTLTVTLPNQANVGGTPGNVTHNVGLLVDFGAQRQTFVYQTIPSDTAASIAASLAALVNVATPANVVGGQITIPAAWGLIGRTGIIGTATRELRRQTDRFDVNIWTTSPAMRDAVGKPIREAFGDIDFLETPDGYAIRLLIADDVWIDEPEKVGVYRRLIAFDVEYPTTQEVEFAEIIFFEVELASGPSPEAAPVVTTIY